MSELSIWFALSVDGLLVAYGIVFLETVQSGLTLSDLYYWFGSGFGDIRHIASSHFTVWDGPLLGSVTAVTVQSFFAYRIWVLSEKKSWWLCLMILLVSPLYFKYGPDASSQRVSLWIVLRRRWNIRGFWGYLCEYVPGPYCFRPASPISLVICSQGYLSWKAEDFCIGLLLCP